MNKFSSLPSELDFEFEVFPVIFIYLMFCEVGFNQFMFIALHS